MDVVGVLLFNGACFRDGYGVAVVHFPCRRTLAGVGNFMGVFPYFIAETAWFGRGESGRAA